MNVMTGGVPFVPLTNPVPVIVTEVPCWTCPVLGLRLVTSDWTGIGELLAGLGSDFALPGVVTAT